MKGMKNPYALALAIALPLCLSSCLAAVAAVGAGGVAYWQYSENEVVGEFDSVFETTWEATVAEVEAQGFGTPTEVDRGVTEGELVSDGWKVRVESITGERTRVRVRIGTFDTDDHERRSRLLLEGISTRLGTSRAEPAVDGAEGEAGSETEPPTAGGSPESAHAEG